jgi:SAM-dependent methyltransferase
MEEQEIRGFWDSHPCGEHLVGRLSERDRGGYEQFFNRYDAFRYKLEGHIPACLDAIPFAGKQVLEIGLGQGADAEQIVRRGARWSGLDLTPESLARVRMRFELRGLPFEDLRLGSALSIPYADHAFDIVYSHGVLHHVPQIREAQKEIARVLKPDGQLIVMLYARWSLNYVLSIAVVRRLGLLALWAAKWAPAGIHAQHLQQAREVGLLRYLRLSRFIHANTDGPQNPFSRVYDLQRVRRDFPSFRVIKAYKRFMHAPPLPVRLLPLGGLLGWHLWVHLRPLEAG